MPILTNFQSRDEYGDPVGDSYVSTSIRSEKGRGLFVHLTHALDGQDSYAAAWISETDGRAILKALAAHFAELDTADAKKAAETKAARRAYKVGDRVRFVAKSWDACPVGGLGTVTGVEDGFLQVASDTYTRTPGFGWHVYAYQVEPAPLEPLFAVGDHVVVHGYAPMNGLSGEGTVKDVIPNDLHRSSPFAYDVLLDSGEHALVAYETELGFPETPAPDRFEVGDVVKGYGSTGVYVGTDAVSGRALVTWTSGAFGAQTRPWTANLSRLTKV